MNSLFGNNDYYSVITERLIPNHYIGAYFPALFYCCVIIIVAAYLINAVLDNKAGLNLFSSLIFPLILTAIASTALCIPQINILQLWAIFYGCILICLHSTFKKLIIHSELVERYADLKLIKKFSLTIKNSISKIIPFGIKQFNNPVDEIIILSASSLILLLEAVVFISYIVYFAAHWRLIFLSFLIN
jgi:hypothetical protein